MPIPDVDKAVDVASDILSNGPIEVVYGAIFKKFDVDGTNRIDYNEFIEL